MKNSKLHIIIVLAFVLFAGHANANGKALTFLRRNISETIRASSFSKAHQFIAYSSVLDVSFCSMGVISTIFNTPLKSQAAYDVEAVGNLTFDPRSIYGFEQKYDLGFRPEALVVGGTKISATNGIGISSLKTLYVNAFLSDIVDSQEQISLFEIGARVAQIVQEYTLLGLVKGEEEAIDNYIGMIRTMVNIFSAVNDKLASDSEVDINTKLKVFYAETFLVSGVVVITQRQSIGEAKQGLLKAMKSAKITSLDIPDDLLDLTFADFIGKHIKFRNLTETLKLPENDLAEDLVDIFAQLNIELVRILLGHYEEFTSSEFDPDLIFLAIASMITAMEVLGIADNSLLNKILQEGVGDYVISLLTSEPILQRAGVFNAFDVDSETGALVRKPGSSRKF